MKVLEALKGYQEYQISEEIDVERTLSKYMMCLQEWINCMNIETTEEIDQLTWIEIKMKYINVKKKVLAAQSINLRITALRSFFNYLVGMRLVRENVCDYIKKEKVNHKHVDVDINKINELIDLLNDEYNENPCYMTARNRMMILLALIVGMRNEELREMNIDDINIFNGEYTTHDSKFDKSRELCLPDKLLVIYRDYLKFRNLVDTDCNKLFLSKSGKKLNKNAPSDLIKNRSNKVGLNLTFHDLRHIAGTTSIMSGNSIEETSKLLGHANSTITSQIYVNDNKTMIRDTVNNNLLLEKI